MGRMIPYMMESQKCLRPPTGISFHISSLSYGDGSKPWYLVNPKIAGKWMFIQLKMYL